MVMSAPSWRQNSSFSADPAVTATRAPSARATWIAWVPMPLAPPCISSSWPLLRWAVITRFDHTVQAPSGNPAASTRSTPSGIGITWPAGTATYWAYPPPASRAQTSCPTDHSVTPEPALAPISEMTPDTSMPMISLAPGGGGYLPAACSTSARLTPAAATLISTSPGPAVTSGTSCQDSCSEDSATMARMPATLLAPLPLAAVAWQSGLMHSL